MALGHYSNLAGMSRDALAANPAIFKSSSFQVVPQTKPNVNCLTDKRGTPAWSPALPPARGRSNEDLVFVFPRWMRYRISSHGLGLNFVN